MKQEKKKYESINDLMSGFPDIIESAYDISDDVDAINDMIESDLRGNINLHLLQLESLHNLLTFSMCRVKQ